MIYYNLFKVVILRFHNILFLFSTSVSAFLVQKDCREQTRSNVGIQLQVQKAGMKEPDQL